MICHLQNSFGNCGFFFYTFGKTAKNNKNLGTNVLLKSLKYLANRKKKFDLFCIMQKMIREKLILQERYPKPFIYWHSDCKKKVSLGNKIIPKSNNKYI